MNKRHNLSNNRLVKQERKEIRKAIHKDTPVEKKAVAAKQALSASNLKRYKKISKRTATSDAIEGSTPAYAHREGKRWIAVLKEQRADGTVRYLKKTAKKRG